MNDSAVSVAVQDVNINRGFMGPIVSRAKSHLISYQWKILNDEIELDERSHCIENYRIAAGVSQGEFYGQVFQDSDFGKWIEALAYKLMKEPDPEMESRADEAIELLAKAQQPDGYLNTYFICHPEKPHWSDLRDCHELYCAGHLLEGAVAYYQATGKRRMLDIMQRYADHIADHFGEAKSHGYPGHAEIELALCKLYDLTQDEKYLELASFFLNQRGREPYYFAWERTRLEKDFFPQNSTYGRDYAQSAIPVRERRTAEGHAVRALYLACGMADVAIRTNDEALWESCKAIFNNIAGRRMYVTGGIGSTYFGEAFTFDYDLPNDTAYAETCASVAMIFFAYRMLLGESDVKYADIMEQALYNTCLAGMSPDQKKFFYVNPLSVWPEADAKDPNKHHVLTQRKAWLNCACCPPNLARLLCSLGMYQYVVRGKVIEAELYLDSELNIECAGKTVKAVMKTDYPDSGMVRINVTEGDYDLRLRIPGWCNSFILKRNDAAVDLPAEKGYITLQGPFADEKIELELQMEPQLLKAAGKVRADAGKYAVRRGPIVYCAEEVDNGPQLHMLLLKRNTQIRVRRDETLLGGTIVLEADGMREHADMDQLYGIAETSEYEEVTIRMIPYYKWANRGSNEMEVWLRAVE